MARWISGVALVLTACLLPTAQAKAAVIYAVSGGISGTVFMPYNFSVTSADFITEPTLLTPSASTCTVPPNPTLVGCVVGPNVIFFPGMLIGNADVLAYLPSQIDWTVSITGVDPATSTTVTFTQSFAAVFGVPYTVGGTAFELPATYPGFSPITVSGLVGVLTVSGSPDTVTPVPEPTSLLLFGSGAVGMLARRLRHHGR